MLPLITFLLFTPVNYTYPTACASFPCLMSWVNTTTNGLGGLIISLCFFAILFVGMLMTGVDLEPAGLTASFISCFITLALIGLGTMNPLYLLIYIASASIFFVLAWTKGASDPYGR